MGGIREREKEKLIDRSIELTEEPTERHMLILRSFSQREEGQEEVHR